MSATLTSAGVSTARAGEADGTAAVPTIADAQQVADAFAEDPNVVRVLLFGSVARDEQHAGSDIDLVVVYADLDYGQREEVDRALCRKAEQLVPWRSELIVTDLPEWTMRTKNVKNSFEASLYCRPLLTLFDRKQVSCRINWAKEQVMPSDDFTNATDFMTHALSTELETLERQVRIDQTIRDRERHNPGRRRRRLIETVEAAALIIEVALKSLAKLVVGELMDKRQLSNAGHAIDECLGLLGDPYQAVLRHVIEAAGLDPKHIGDWRTQIYQGRKGTDHRGRLLPDAANDKVDQYVVVTINVSDLVLAEFEKHWSVEVPNQLTEVAVAMSDVVLEAYEQVSPANGSGRDEVDSTRESWQFVKDTYETIDIRTAEVRPTPLDLTPMLQGNRDALTRALEDASADEATA